MTDDKNHGAIYGFSGEQGDDQGHYDAPASPKHHKKDSKRYVAFHSDELDSSEVEEESQAQRKERKKLKKDRSNTFREKFKSIKVKKKEKEGKEKSKEKEDKKEKKEKKKHKRSLSAGDSLTPIQIQSPPPVAPVFGVALEVAVSRSKFSDGIELPRVFRECIVYLEEKGLDQEGIYRVSGIKSKIDELKSLYNHGMKVDLESDDIEPNIVAGLLKLYLRELPVNILTPKLLPVFDSLVGLKDESEQVDKMKQLLADLPKPNYTLISWLFVHLDHVMQKGSETKMGIQNISIVFSPTMNISHGILFIIMTHIKEFFPGVQIIKYVEPVKPKADTEVPHSPRSLEEELSKQEVFLDDLHRRMNRDEANEEEVMEQMWEIQRTVTQLKRRLKTIRRSQQPKPSTEGESPKPELDTNESQSKVKENSAERLSTNQEQREQMQLEIDQGKTKLQSLIKEETINRQRKELQGEDTAVKGDSGVRVKEVYSVKQKDADGRRGEEVRPRYVDGRRWEKVKNRDIDGRRGEEVKHRDIEGRRGEDVGHRDIDERRGEEVKHRDTDERRGEEVGQRNIDGRRWEKVKHRDIDGRRGEEVEQRDIDRKRGAEGEDSKRMEKKKDEARLKKRNEEHSRILEQSKENEVQSRASVEEAVKREDEVSKEDEDDILQDEKEELENEEAVENEPTSEDDEMKELLREEYRLMIEQEELLDLSARLKDRIQREWNDVDRLKLEIDELKKRENRASNISSSNEDSSSNSSDSGTDSDENNSDLEDILKELEKENEKLENQTMDLMRALVEERAKTLTLQVDLRMIEECKI